MSVEVRKRTKAGYWLAVLLLTLVMSVSSLAVPAAAGQYEDAEAAYGRGDYPTAFRLMSPLAEEGNPYAQAFVGFLYWHGKGAPQDYAEAVKWYRKAADYGLPSAQYQLGLAYYKGLGVPQDHTEAIIWYWTAAKRGEPHAQINLGVMFQNGEGGPKNYVLAHMWYNIAASRLPESDAKLREIAIKNRELVASMMTPAQIAKAQQMAREWKPEKP